MVLQLHHTHLLYQMKCRLCLQEMPQTTVQLIALNGDTSLHMAMEPLDKCQEQVFVAHKQLVRAVSALHIQDVWVPLIPGQW